MKIKVEAKNKAKIEAALIVVNGQSVAHTYTTYEEIGRLMASGEFRLHGLSIPKGKRKGATLLAESGDDLPNSYKWSRKTTVVTMERTSTGWFITDIRADNEYQKSMEFTLNITPAQDAIAVAALRSGYRVASTAKVAA